MPHSLPPSCLFFVNTTSYLNAERPATAGGVMAGGGYMASGRGQQHAAPKSMQKVEYTATRKPAPASATGTRRDLLTVEAQSPNGRERKRQWSAPPSWNHRNTPGGGGEGQKMLGSSPQNLGQKSHMSYPLLPEDQLAPSLRPALSLVSCVHKCLLGFF